MTAKTKRDRAAGRAHRHTAIQTIVNNHQGIIDDIASIDNSIAAPAGRNLRARQPTRCLVRPPQPGR